MTAECRHWENGEFVTTPAMSTQQQFTCPEDVGTYNIYRMYHEELESLTKHLSDAEEGAVLDEFR